jgi:hypothetical protein
MSRRRPVKGGNQTINETLDLRLVVAPPAQALGKRIPFGQRAKCFSILARRVQGGCKREEQLGTIFGVASSGQGLTKTVHHPVRITVSKIEQRHPAERTPFTGMCGKDLLIAGSRLGCLPFVLMQLSKTGECRNEARVALEGLSELVSGLVRSEKMVSKDCSAIDMRLLRLGNSG